MANYSQTSSGDLTSYVAGKIFSAANLAKEEKERRKEEGIEQAQPGSLFARALQHEFGGDLYNRTFGIFDPRKKHPETDRKSSKESRFASQFPQKEKTDDSGTRKRKSKVAAATRELMSDDDSLPVKDKDLRQQISKIFGAGVDARLVAAEAKISRVNAQVLGVHDSLRSTQQLILDQNDILLSKFDQILEIFGKQAEFQEKLKDKAEAAEKERIIEESKDLSSTRGLIDTSAMAGGTSVPSRIARFYKNRAVRKLYRQLPKSVRQTRRTIRNIQRVPGKLTNKVSQQITSRLPGRANQAASALTKLRGVGQVARNTGPLKYAFAGMEYADRKNAGQNELQALSGVGGGLAGAAAGGWAGAQGGAAIGGAIGLAFGGIGAGPGALIGGIIGGLVGSITGGIAGGKISDTVTGVHETGTGMTKPGTGLLHGKELILGTTDRKDIKNSYIDSMQTIGSTLVSSAVSLGDAVGQGRQVRAEANKLGLDYKIIQMPLKTEVGKSTKTKPDTKLLAGIVNPFSALQEQMERQRGDGTTPTETPIITPLNTDQAEAFEKIRKIAERVGSPKPEVTAAIAMLESGWLANPNSVYFASGKTNPFGQTGRGPKGFVIGKDGQEHAVYNSLEEGVKAHVDRWKSSYIGKTDEEIIESIRSGAGKGAPGQYNTRPGWTQDVLGVLQSSRAQNDMPLDGSFASGSWIGPTGDTDGQQTGLNMNLPGGIGTPIYAPFDMIYKSTGTDGNPSVGLQGTPNVLGPKGTGFGYYGAYRFVRNGKEYEVLMGHFKQLPFKGSSDGEVIKKGTLLGYQGASGRSVSSSGGVYPHISLHVNGVGFKADNSTLVSVARSIASSGGSGPSTSSGSGASPPARSATNPSAGSNPSTTPSSIFKWPGGGSDGLKLIRKTPMIKGGEGGPGGSRTLAPEQKALLKTISFAEGTTGSYGTIFGGKIVPELEQGIMTVREVYNMMMTGRVRGRDAGYAKGSYATGRYQLMPDTLWDLVKGGHVNWSERMTHQLQDYLILKRMETFRGVSASDLRKKGLSRGIMDKLSGEFASFPTYSGSSAYGQPVKSPDTLQQKYDSILRQILLEQKKQQELERQRKLKEEEQRRNIFNQIQNILPGGMKGLIPSQLLSDSSVLESMEENAVQTQFVIINNQMIASSDTSKDIMIPASSEVDTNELYRMAVLGA